MEPTLESTPRRDVSAVLWLGLPLATIAARLLLACLPEERWEPLMGGETGLIENATVVFLLPAVVFGVLVFLLRRELPRGVGWWMLLIGLAALFFAGEECSWGQVYFGWDTPEAIAKINDQNESNLHRIWAIFNNVPRQMLRAGIILGGIVLPLAPFFVPKAISRPAWLGRLNQKSLRLIAIGRDPRRSLYWLVPNYRLVPVSILAVGMRLAHDIVEHVGVEPARGTFLDQAFFRDSGEFMEFYFALAILFYLLSVYLRMGKKQARSPSSRR